MPVAAESYLDYAHTDPNPFFQQVREQGRVVWDEGLQSWLITEFEDVWSVLRDEDQFATPFVRFRFSDFFGRRGLLLLGGEPHRQLYITVRRFFTPQAAEAYREHFLSEIIEERMAKLLAAGRAEIAADYAEQIPVRVIAGILGLDWRDDELIRNCWDWIDAYQIHTLNYILPGHAPEQTHAAAAEGMRKVDDVLRPLVEAKKHEPEDSYIKAVDQKGREVFADWSDADTVDQCKFLFVAGMHTTTALICNATHLLLTNPRLMATVADDPHTHLGPLVEETLRLRPSIQLRPRVAANDLEWHGAQIREGDQIVAILASANRSGERFEHPHDIDLSRDNISSHLAFNAGPRFCGGAPLARVEAVESLRNLVTRLPQLRLDTSQSEPRYTGFIQRTMRPLHVLFGRDSAPAAESDSQPAESTVRGAQ